MKYEQNHGRYIKTESYGPELFKPYKVEFMSPVSRAGDLWCLDFSRTVYGDRVTLELRHLLQGPGFESCWGTTQSGKYFCTWCSCGSFLASMNL